MSKDRHLVFKDGTAALHFSTGTTLDPTGTTLDPTGNTLDPTGTTLDPTGTGTTIVFVVEEMVVLVLSCELWRMCLWWRRRRRRL